MDYCELIFKMSVAYTLHEEKPAMQKSVYFVSIV